MCLFSICLEIISHYLRHQQGSRLTGLFCFVGAWLDAKCVLVLVSVFLTPMGSGYLCAIHRGRICGSWKNRYKCVKPHAWIHTRFFSLAALSWKTQKDYDAIGTVFFKLNLRPSWEKVKFQYSVKIWPTIIFHSFYLLGNGLIEAWITNNYWSVAWTIDVD